MFAPDGRKDPTQSLHNFESNIFYLYCHENEAKTCSYTMPEYIHFKVYYQALYFIKVLSYCYYLPDKTKEIYGVYKT